MKISYKWLVEYVETNLSPENIAEILTDIGLEVEGLEKFQTVKGELEGLIIGEVKSKEKHPNADRLNLTKVDVGNGELLSIVCGASNVEAGQKVVVAPPGTTIYPFEGEPFKIKKTKIRGELSEGMICAEDEIGLGAGHEGIMVLDPQTKPGTPAKEYFNVDSDWVFEIGLTPNRADAASHIGVARDLLAALTVRNEQYRSAQLKRPDVGMFATESNQYPVKVEVVDSEACPRYAGVTIADIKVAESPQWLKNRLLAIGLNPINNIVDITNFVLHETGQPLHAFDLAQVNGSKVVVKKLAKGTKFVTLDKEERELSGEDLMICNETDGMCIAGVFGGLHSGVKESTTAIFLESACFQPVSIRKTAKFHALSTDASFRFERGVDPENTVFALKRAALLIKEIAGGQVASDIIDIYPQPAESFKVSFRYERCDQLIGKKIDRKKIREILQALEIEIKEETDQGLRLVVPRFKVDVQREVDIIEEVLRIYGYNNIEDPGSLKSSISYSEKPNKRAIKEHVSSYLSSNGFNEIMANSLTSGFYHSKLKSFGEEKNVKVLNPLSSELDVLRQSLLFGGLESVLHNQNRKRSDLKLYEFGNVYKKADQYYDEQEHLSILISGKKHQEHWLSKEEEVNFYTLKSYVHNVLSRVGVRDLTVGEELDERFQYGLHLLKEQKHLALLGEVNKDVLEGFDIRQRVFYAEFNWSNVLQYIPAMENRYIELPKFPEVKRDLALLVDKELQFAQIEKLAYKTEGDLLKNVNLFDLYEGKNIPEGKKSYAVSFILQDMNKTLTDQRIDQVMSSLQKTFESELGAQLR